MDRRFTRFFTTFLLTGTVLTGCTNTQEVNTVQEENTSKETIALTVWGSEADQQLLNDLVTSFEEKHSDTVNLDITVGIQEELEVKKAILDSVHEAPDVFTFADDQLLSLASAGVLSPIEYAEEVRANNVESAVTASIIEDEVYAYPLTADNGYFLYYNSEYLTAEDVQTLDNILDIAKTNNKKISMDITSGWYLYSFFGNTGLTVGLNPDNITNYCTWNSTDGAIHGVDVMESLDKLVKHKGFAPYGDDAFVKGISNGEVIAGVSGVWLEETIKQALGDNFEVAKLPTYTVNGGQVQMASFTGHKMVGVNAYSDNKEWAEELANFITNEENQIKRFEERKQLPSNINAANHGDISKSKVYKALNEQSKYAKLQKIGNRYWAPTTELVNQLIRGEANEGTYQELLDKAVKEITSDIVD